MIDKELLRRIFRDSRSEADSGRWTGNWERAWENLSFAADALHAMMVRKETLDSGSHEWVDDKSS